MRKVIQILLLLCFATSTCLAAEYSVFQPVSAVTFQVKRGLVIMHGRVFNYDITFEYSSDDPTSWRIEAELPVQGIHIFGGRLSRQAKQDGNLFKLIEYPTIYFDSREVLSADKEGAVVRGLLSLNGFEKEVDLKISINGENSFTDQNDKRKVIGIHAEATINRRDFDILWPSERRKKQHRGGAKFGDEVLLVFDLLGMEIR